ncbi:MAG: phosphopantetheine-binding protein [Catenulispora sp.]
MPESEPGPVLARLETLLDEVWDTRPADRSAPVDHDLPLPSLGIDSLTLILLLDRVGSEFGIDWEHEPEAAAVGSLRSLADLVVRVGAERAGRARS